MALEDINYQEGEGQDFIIEIPSAVYAGLLADILVETNSTQYLLLEAPTAGGNVFIMSE